MRVSKDWLTLLGMKGQEKAPFSGLSFGEQRQVLIARAMVKLPLILLLDEPCLGLDNHNRAQVLALIDYIAGHSQTHILPCWVLNDPACDDQGDEYKYFVGQNSIKDASKGRPNQSAFGSARMSSKTQYVSYLEETILTKASEAFTVAGDAEEGAETVSALKQLTKTFAQKTVSGLKQLDSYYISEGENSKEIPLWTVYVRMRVTTREVRDKFGMLVDNVKKSADDGNKKAEKILNRVQNIQKTMKKDDFFKGF